MSYRKSFQDSWKRQFPYDSLPVDIHFFLESNPDPDLLDDILDKTMLNIERLRKEQNQQNFIAQFLLQLKDDPEYCNENVSSEVDAEKPAPGGSPYPRTEKLITSSVDDEPASNIFTPSDSVNTKELKENKSAHVVSIGDNKNAGEPENEGMLYVSSVSVSLENEKTVPAAVLIPSTDGKTSTVSADSGTSSKYSSKESIASESSTATELSSATDDTCRKQLKDAPPAEVVNKIYSPIITTAGSVRISTTTSVPIIAKRSASSSLASDDKLGPSACTNKNISATQPPTATEQDVLECKHASDGNHTSAVNINSIINSNSGVTSSVHVETSGNDQHDCYDNAADNVKHESTTCGLESRTNEIGSSVVQYSQPTFKPFSAQSQSVRSSEKKSKYKKIERPKSFAYTREEYSNNSRSVGFSESEKGRERNKKFGEKEVVVSSLDVIKHKLGLLPFKPLSKQFTSSPSIPASLAAVELSDTKTDATKVKKPFYHYRPNKELGSSSDLRFKTDLGSTNELRSSGDKRPDFYRSSGDLRVTGDISYNKDFNNYNYKSVFNRNKDYTQSSDSRKSSITPSETSRDSVDLKPDLPPKSTTNSGLDMESGSRLSDRIAIRTSKIVESLTHKKDTSPSPQRKDPGKDAYKTSGLATVAIAVPGACVMETDIDAPYFESPRASRSIFYDAILHPKKASPSGSDAPPLVPRRQPSPTPVKPELSPTLAKPDQSNGNETRASKARSRQMDVYEDAIPFRKSTAGGETEGVEEGKKGSSDESDDEPIYFNMLLVRQKTFNQANTLLHSKVGHANKFDQQVRKLSMRYEHGKRPSTADIKQKMTTEVEDGRRNSGASLLDDGLDGHVNRVKRRSMALALDSDSQSDFDELDVIMPPVGAMTEENVTMRKWIIENIVEGEVKYVADLGDLLQLMVQLKNVVGTPQEVISLQDIDTIFHKIPELHKSHSIFSDKLKPKVEHFTEDQCVAEIFYELAPGNVLLIKSRNALKFKQVQKFIIKLTECVLASYASMRLKELSANEEYKVATSYLKNYNKAVTTVRRCCQESAKFLELITPPENKKDTSTSEIAAGQRILEDLIYKPVVRFQRNSLVLKDLIAKTPTAHADYDLLQKTLQISQNFLENLKDPSAKDNKESQRYLAKHDFIVESIGGERKLRHLFLFNDILVCARQKASGSKEKFTFETKWFIPVTDIMFDDISAITERSQITDSKADEVDQLRRKVNALQSDLKVENRRAQVSTDAQRQSSLRSHNKNMDKIKKKLLEQKVHLLLASPQLVLSIRNRKSNKSYFLLLPSDYERTNWKSAISGLLKKPQTSSALTTAELNTLLNNLKLPKLSTMGALLINDDFGLDEEYISGSLSVTVRQLEGLKLPSDTYCSIELDSYGHFFMQAKTNVIRCSTNPKWDEEFDIDLEGAQTLRILCYKIEGKSHQLCGKCAFELSKDWLKGNVIHETISLGDEMSISFSLSLRTRDQTLKRTLSTAREGLFGAKIHSVTRRERLRMPLIVSSCIEEIESRGLKDVGIYRVSGLSGEIQKFKKAFEKNSRAATNLLKTADVNVITCLLKLYLRELPEALFTDALYPNFVNCMSFSDPDSKEKYMIQLIRSLPEPNYTTAMYTLDHLIRVSKHVDQNKMTLANLATVFGPTLFRPAVKPDSAQSDADKIKACTHDAMTQVAILLFILNLKAKGVSFGSR